MDIEMQEGACARMRGSNGMRRQKIDIKKSLVILTTVVLLSALFISPVLPQRGSQLNRWVSGSGMLSARSGASSVILSDGRILIAGGESTDGILNSAEIYDASGVFTYAASMSVARADHMCVVLSDGRVMAAGGRTAGGGLTDTVEVYDPEKDTWTLAGSMSSVRAGATASLLRSGLVLIAGGVDGSGSALASMEIYHPFLNEIAPVSAVLSTPRTGHAAVVLDDWQVLIVGGSDGNAPLNSAEVFNEPLGSIYCVGKMSVARSDLSATKLRDGKVLLAGGVDEAGDSAVAEIYDPQTRTISPTGSLQIARHGQQAVRLPDNNSVLVYSGTSFGAPLSGAELYVPWQGMSKSIGNLTTPRAAASGAPLGRTGRFLIAGGKSMKGALSSDETSSFATLTTDSTDYTPGTIVKVTGTGWLPGETVNLVFHEVNGPDPDFTAQAVADALGNFTYNQFAPDIQDIGVIFTLTATGSSSGITAQTSFWDANQSANLDQCANGPDGSLACLDPNWVNGNLGGSRSRYFEGDSIPYRLRMANLTSGTHAVTIEWDTTKGGDHAIDYLTSWSRTVNPGSDPCSGFINCSPITPSTFAIAPDPSILAKIPTPIPGSFMLYGGTIQSLSAYTVSGTYTADSSTRITISFTANSDSGGNAVLAWGGHIATRNDWRPQPSALDIPGSPYHMRLIDLDGSGGNQDRSLSADAVIFPGSITIIKSANPKGSTPFSFIAGPDPLGSFTLTDNDTSADTQKFASISVFQTYTVQENPPSGWTLDTIACSATNGNSTSTWSRSGSAETINLKEGDEVTCTFSNSHDTGSLTVTKSVTGAPSEFTGSFGIHVACTDAGVVTYAGDGAISYPKSPSITFSQIPTGGCTVTETSISAPPPNHGWGSTTISPSSVSVTKGATANVTVTNPLIQDIGSLRISKMFDAGSSGFTGKFTINYDCSDGTAHDGSVTLAAGGSQTISGIRAGTVCTVTEPTFPAPPAGWIFGTPLLDPASGQVTIVKSSTVAVSVTNTIGSDTGALTIRKIFDPLTSGFTGRFKIHFDCDDGTAHDGSVTLASGESETISGIPVGTVCTVTEPTLPTPPTGWDFGTPKFVPSNGKVTIVESPAAEVSVTNTISRYTGSLKISKTFNPLASGFTGKFTINYDCNDGTAHDGSVTLAAGESDTISGIPVGTVCTVTEPILPTPPTGWTLGTPALNPVSGEVTIVKSAATEVRVTNSITRDQGTLEVRKVLDPGTDNGVFNLQINDATAGTGANRGNGGTTGAVTEHTGNYSVGEAAGTDTSLADYATTIACTDGTTVIPATTGTSLSNVPVKKGKAMVCTITNLRVGHVTVAKTVNDGTGGASGSYTFTFGLRTGASLNSKGDTLEEHSITLINGNSGNLNFSTPLRPESTYNICELTVPGWGSTLPAAYSIPDPNAADPAWVCSNFVVTPGQTYTIRVDNWKNSPNGLAKTIGYWKNHASCANSNGNQTTELDKTLYTSDHLSDNWPYSIGVSIGTLTLHGGATDKAAAPVCRQAVNLLNKSTATSGKKMASDPAFNLAAQLLAAILNVDAGAAMSPNDAAIVSKAAQLLRAHNFNGDTHTPFDAAEASLANQLAALLDSYNNSGELVSGLENFDIQSNFKT